MAVRSTSRRDDEDALDPVEAADESHLDEVEEADDPVIEGADVFDDEPEDPADLEDDEVEDEVDDVVGDDPDVELETEVEVPAAVIPAEAAFDDDEDDTVVAVVADDDEDGDDEIEGVRDGEFVCRGCYMAKRDTQLADADRLLCRDCAA